MIVERARNLLGAAAATWIGVHLTATVLQNTPESFNQDLRKFTGGWPIPGWRFFAPNPGIQNVHLLVRERSSPERTSAWRDVTPAMRHGFVSALWNPGSRGPKALFDAMQQISVMSANQAQFGWVTQSAAYGLVVSAATSTAAVDGAEEMQFLLMNVFPNETEDKKMKPILVSEWFGIGSGPAHAEVSA